MGHTSCLNGTLSVLPNRRGLPISRGDAFYFLSEYKRPWEPLSFTVNAIELVMRVPLNLSQYGYRNREVLFALNDWNHRPDDLLSPGCFEGTFLNLRVFEVF